MNEPVEASERLSLNLPVSNFSPSLGGMMRRTIFDEDHEAFRESCRTFVDRTLRPNQEKHIANHGFGREVWL
jgi:hypothetical protein